MVTKTTQRPLMWELRTAEGECSAPSARTACLAISRDWGGLNDPRAAASGDIALP